MEIKMSEAKTLSEIERAAINASLCEALVGGADNSRNKKVFFFPGLETQTPVIRIDVRDAHRLIPILDRIRELGVKGVVANLSPSQSYPSSIEIKGAIGSPGFTDALVRAILSQTESELLNRSAPREIGPPVFRVRGLRPSPGGTSAG
jgi:hypothetical protein